MVARNFEPVQYQVKESINHFLFPSTLLASTEPHYVQTVLGSCISVCLYDELMMWGGINHYMMPWWNGKGVPSPKYGDVAIEQLIEKLIAKGSQKFNLVAKIFGGACQHSIGSGSIDIGSRNIATAESELKKHGIKIVSKSVGGMCGRKIVFDTQTGKVFLKYLDPIND